MDIKDYISSGIIETYVLGAATTEEIRQLKLLCEQYPEVKEALQEAQDSLGSFAAMDKEQPPAKSRDEIFDRLINEDLIAINPQDNMPRADAEPDISDPIRRAIPVRRASPVYAYVAAASMLLLLAGSIYHFRIVGQLKEQVSSLLLRQNTLLAQNASYEEQLQAEKNIRSIITQPSVLQLSLAGVEGHEDNSALVYWDQKNKDVYLLPNNLPKLSAEQQYQLWAIVDGKPVSAGVYNSEDLQQIQKMLSIERAQMFAVTVEKAGGVEQPTLSQMVVAAPI